MIYLISGATHSGKTLLAQRLMETLHISVLSQDHLKMGLIRSGQTDLTPMDDDKLTDYLWPITREIIKTAIENHQSLIVEGCYIPFDFERELDKCYLDEIQAVWIVLSEQYIKTHEKEIIEYGNVIERRMENSVDSNELIAENQKILRECEAHHLNVIEVKQEYDVFEQAKKLFRCMG